MHLINWLNEYPPFIEEVSDQVREAMKGRAISHGLPDGKAEGEVTAFRLTAPLVLEFADCVDLTCAIPFRCSGVATGIAEDGSVFTTAEGSVHGIVDTRFPDDKWSMEAYLRMYPHIERIVSVDAVEFENEDDAPQP